MIPRYSIPLKGDFSAPNVLEVALYTSTLKQSSRFWKEYRTLFPDVRVKISLLAHRLV